MLYSRYILKSATFRLDLEDEGAKMKNVEIARRIIEASKNNSLTFFVGAGVSKCSGIPLWKELIREIWLKMGLPDSKEFSADEYLKIPQMFYSTCKDSRDYSYFIKNALDKPDAVPNEVHRLMLTFHPTSFLTTNFDHLLENAAIEYGQSYKNVANDEEVASINGDRFILKVHGDIEHDNFVLKEEDYLAYEDNYKLIPSLMRSVFSTNTVVFIGYGIGDYNVKLILDGVRRVLKDKFEPIFIRVNEEPLSDEEQKYYESKGLNVIEYSKVTTSEERTLLKEDDYEAKYISVLNYISSVTKKQLIGETDEESFSNLYNSLLPLDKLSALRIADIHNRISECCSISSTGVVHLFKRKESPFRKFIAIHELSDDDRKKLSKNELKMYHLIRRVLNKGRVFQINDNHRIIDIYDERISFADDKCIIFDYWGMTNYCKSVYKEIPAKFKRAFYLTRLRRFEEAFDAFLEVAKYSFKSKDYVFFYLAEINCIALRKILQNPLVRFNKSKELCEKEKELIIWETENALFDSLPQEFKNEYKTLRELCTKEFLYQYGFEASVDATKLEKAINTHRIEMGESSSGRVVSRVNDYLHFLLGNGVCLDLFSEYKVSVCTLMERLIQKYVDQQHKTLRDSYLPSESKIYFDQYDFYCFVRFFKASELEKVLRNSKCKIIEFGKMECIESAIHNLIVYSEKVIREAKTHIELDELLGEMDTCFVLARYMRLSEAMVEEICHYILKYNSRYIFIDQKVLFLDFQVYFRHISNANIQKDIENTLIKYIDVRLFAIKGGNTWESFSKYSEINYPNIADYLDIDKEGIISRRLSKRVSTIIDEQIISLQKECVEHYLNHISKNQVKRLSKWIEAMLIDNFEFERFALLIQLNARKARKYSDKLFLYLDRIEKEEKHKVIEKIGIAFNLDVVPHEELLNVGLWCMCGLIDAQKFMPFKGIDLQYDFLIDSTNFDYSQFNVGWLLRMPRQALEAVAKRASVRNKILKIVIQEIRKDELKQDDKESLIRLLGEHFAY